MTNPTIEVLQDEYGIELRDTQGQARALPKTWTKSALLAALLEGTETVDLEIRWPLYAKAPYLRGGTALRALSLEPGMSGRFTISRVSSDQCCCGLKSLPIPEDIP